MERAANFSRLALGIEGAGFVEGAGIEREEGGEFRAGLVVGGDAREVGGDEFFGGEGAGGQRGLEVGGGGGGEV